MATSIKQAKEIYDNFFGTLRNLNGGTSEENERSAAYCYERLKEHAQRAEEAAKNPSNLLVADCWYWERLTVTLPERLAEFKKRYNLEG